MVFSIFFSSKKELPPQCNKRKENERNIHLDAFQSVPRLPKLSKDKIRVLIYKESERRTDKTLLFDSDAIVCVDNEKQNTSKKPSTHSSCSNQDGGFDHSQGLKSPKYQCTKPNSDVKMLGEMIFGSVAMVYKGSVLKVHYIRTPPQLMMTKVFALRSRSAGVNFCDREFSSSRLNDSTDSLYIDSRNSSPNEEPSRSYSNPVGMSRPSKHQVRSSLAKMSGIDGSSWSIASLDNSSSLSSSLASLNGTSMCSPSGSMRQRFLRSQRTSINSTFSWRSKSDVTEEMRSAYKQQPKIGIGIIFKLWDKNEYSNRDFQKFFFSHYTLFEAHLQTLRVKIEKSFYLRQRFMDTALHAIEDFKDDVMRLYYAPRINEPVWLNLMVTSESSRRNIVDKFMASFIELSNLCETKEKKYFLSTVLTSVLTYHLSWITTVMSFSKDSKRAYLDKHASNTMNVLSKCHPYNPLWAQLCDLYGSVTNPMIFSRTIIVGKDAPLVCELLKLLTYFIRCCDLKENRIRMVKGRESRISECSLSGSHFSQTPSSPISVRSWVETSNQNIIPINNSKVNDCVKKTNTTVTPKSTVENLVNPVWNIENILKNGQLELQSCYCNLLQNFDKIDEKELTKFIFRFDDRKIRELLDISNTYDKKNNSSSPKSCHRCHTLEKEMFDKFCDSCSNVKKNDISLEIDLVCHHCIAQIEKLKSNIECNNQLKSLCSCKGDDGINHKCKCNLVETNVQPKENLPNINKHRFIDKPSFICYCCPKITEECLAENSKDFVENNCDTYNEDVCFTPRCRNYSDPMDFVVPKVKATLIRNSTTSHDSGTEMSYTSSCQEDSVDSECLSRHNSLSSQDDFNSIDQSAVDSDYCSVDNETLAACNVTKEKTLYLETSEETISDETLVTPRNEDVVLKSTISDVEFRKHFNVSKSLSSTTLKDVSLSALSSSLENSGSLKHVSISTEENEITSLRNDLEYLNLQQIQMPRTLMEPPKSSSKPVFESSNYGRTLMAGYCDSYQSNFILHGTPSLDKKKLATDLQNSVKYSILDEQVADAVCIVADTDNWTCDLWTLSKRTDLSSMSTSESLDVKTMYSSDLVSTMVESTNELWEMGMPSQFCLLHIEEQLKDIYNRARVSTQLTRGRGEVETLKFLQNAGYHESDINLLKAITSTFI